MTWRKRLGSPHFKGNDVLLTILLVLTLVGFVSRKPAIFVIVGLFACYYILYTLYDNQLNKKIKLENKRQTIRLFPEEEDILTFELQNYSGYPAINGKFTFEMDTSVQAVTEEQATVVNEHWNKYAVPSSLIHKGKTTIKMPIHAVQRGTVRIRNIAYAFPHLYNYAEVILHYIPFFHTEILVYPKLLPVQGVETVFEITHGSQRTNFSPYEDIQSARGTRDYSPSDPFHRINWKVSAKTQELQTNVYDKMIDRSYVFIVNIGIKHGDLNLAQFNENLEDILSYTAYLCQYATEKGFPFSVYINARKPGRTPYIHLPAGEGKTHFANALEMLARIKRQSMIIPFEQMLHRIGLQFFKPQSIVVFGEISDDSAAVIDAWKGTQQNVSRVKPVEDGAVMLPWTYGKALNRAE